MIKGASTLTVPNEMACLPAIQSFAGEFVKALGFPDGDTEKILLALEEAVVNVIEHAFESKGESFRIVFEPGVTGITITVRDKGLPYDPGTVPEYAAPLDAEHTAFQGLGSFLMRECVDEVSFHNLGKEGKELCLVKYLPEKRITEYEDEPVPETKIAAAGSEGSETLDIRLMKPSEAVEVSRLFYRAYGYSYFADVMYYPDRLAELNRKELMSSVVAVTGSGEIVGHVAIFRDEPGDVITEEGKAAVKPGFRNQDIFGRMKRRVTERAKELGLKGLYGRAVTVHTYTQKMTEREGHKDCAVVLCSAPADVSFKEIAENLSQRGTYVFSFLPLVDLPVTSVYLPPQHDAILKKICAHLGLKRNFMDSPEDVPIDDHSVIKSRVQSEANTAEIVVDRYGKDCIALLRSLVRDLCVRKVDQITLFLDLGNPATSRMCEEFENLGFLFSGVLPCLHFDDTLMLQYLNNITVDYRKIQTHSAMTKEMLAYIEERDRESRG